MMILKPEVQWRWRHQTWSAPTGWCLCSPPGTVLFQLSIWPWGLLSSSFVVDFLLENRRYLGCPWFFVIGKPVESHWKTWMGSSSSVAGELASGLKNSSLFSTFILCKFVQWFYNDLTILPWEQKWTRLQPGQRELDGLLANNIWFDNMQNKFDW